MKYETNEGMVLEDSQNIYTENVYILFIGGKMH